MAISYQDSGVDVERGYKAVELMKKHVQSTFKCECAGRYRLLRRLLFDRRGKDG